MADSENSVEKIIPKTAPPNAYRVSSTVETFSQSPHVG
jgi:hypothetical protein